MTSRRTRFPLPAALVAVFLVLPLTAAAQSPGAEDLRQLSADAAGCGPQPFACNLGMLRRDLSAGDCHSGRGSYFDLYSFAVDPGEMVTATVSSASFEGYIALVDPGGRIVTQHKADPGEKAFLAYPAEAGGVYDLITSSAGAEALGGYDIALGCLPVEAPAEPIPCTGADGELCLSGGRFRVDTWWQTPDGRMGRGQGQQIGDDSGFFWFFREGRAEVMVKAIDGCAVNDHAWVFTAGMTNVHTAIRVTDTGTGATRWYFNPQTTGFKGVQDTTALANCG